MLGDRLSARASAMLLTPIFGAFPSWLLLGDPVTPPLVAGLILVAAGIAVVIRPA